jgi:Uma2 family endonuclease
MYPTDPMPDPKTLLPTMYDLPSEDPEEPGLPDLFHLLQPRLLDYTFRPPNYPQNKIFLASNLNLYYDLQNYHWYKKPDWFAVVGVNRLYEQRDLRLSYVIWQEEVSPLIVVELLSPGTEDEDLGRKLRDVKQPPGKWEVYERILQIPYYAVFDRYKYEFRLFELRNDWYAEVELSDNKFWIPELELGLGVWEGKFQESDEQQVWLRWYDSTGNWVLLPEELERQLADSEIRRADSEIREKELERQRADSERLKKEMLIAQLRAMGCEPDMI